MRNFSKIIAFCLLYMAIYMPVLAQSPPKPRDTTIKGPQTFAMIMGISKYQKIKPLTYANKDAEMFRDYLKSPAGGKLPDENIYCLLDEQALAATFLVQGFSKWLKAKSLQKGDRLFIYLAGHGDAIDEDNFFYLTYDCNPAGEKSNYLVSGTIRMFDIKGKISREVTKGVEVYLIMDACRSNELPGGTEGQSFFNQAISEYRAGEIMMLAAKAGQESLEDASIGSGHGLFTYYLVDGLNGMADTDGVKDNKVTLKEIRDYVDKHVPSIAKERFKRKQEPFFCCDENSTKIVSLVDTGYLRKWNNLKKLQGSNTGTAVAPRSRGRSNVADTQLIQAYNRFNDAIKANRLIGNNSAETFYNYMESKFPGDAYTSDAQTTLAVEYVNFAQNKINQYLECRDASSIQRLRAQIDKEDETDEINSSLSRMEKVAQQEFYEVGYMMEKAIQYLKADDPEFAKSLMGRMFFFKARGYFARNQQRIDRNTAFQYAYQAYSADKKAPYILNTLSNLHLDNNRYDSAIYYANKAIQAAPRWRYPYVTLAFVYKTQKNPDSAIKYYRKSIEVNPDNADAYVDLGHYFYSLSKGDSAIKYYEYALKLEPGNAYASNNIGWVNLARKNYDKAIASFKQSITANPKVISAYNGISKTFVEIQQFDSARIYYTKAFAHYKDQSIVNVYLGNLYKELKLHDSAKIYYRKAALMDPSYEEAFNNLGQASMSLNQLDSADFYFRKALKANPNSAFALINLGKIFKELKKPDSTYYYFQQAVRLEPGNPSILNNLGVIFGQDKNYDSAKKYFRKALIVRPDYKPASNNLIKIFKDLNEVDSITSLMKGISLFEPGSTGYLNNLGMTFMDIKKYDSAGWYIRKAIQKDPGNAQYNSNLALVFQKMKLYDSSRFYMQKAMKSDPGNSIIWGNLAGVFRQLNLYDSAAFYFKKELFSKVAPGPQAFIALANYYSEIKMSDSAIFYYRKVIALDSKFIPAYAGIGAVFMEMELYDSALLYYDQALTLNPKSATNSLNLGLSYHLLNKYEKAIECISAAVKLDPAKPKPYFQLACSYAMAKKSTEAISYLKQAYDRGYKNKDALLEDQDLDGLRELKEFKDLLDKIIPDWKNR